MKLLNINYKGRILCPIDELHFPESMRPPHQLIFYGPNNQKLLVYRSGKCRLMGCKEPVTTEDGFDIPFRIESMMSLTCTMTFEKPINLIHLAQRLGHRRCIYECEIFPALRLIKFNPACVNVFSSGKIVCMGVKTLNYKKFCRKIYFYLIKYL